MNYLEQWLRCKENEGLYFGSFRFTNSEWIHHYYKVPVNKIAFPLYSKAFSEHYGQKAPIDHPDVIKAFNDDVNRMLFGIHFNSLLET